MSQVFSCFCLPYAHISITHTHHTSYYILLLCPERTAKTPPQDGVAYLYYMTFPIGGGVLYIVIMNL